MHKLRDQLKRPETLRVIVELEVRSPQDKDLEHLGDLGLDVERVVGNKVVGSIPAAKLEGLEADDSVRMVERSESSVALARAPSLPEPVCGDAAPRTGQDRRLRRQPAVFSGHDSYREARGPAQVRMGAQRRDALDGRHDHRRCRAGPQADAAYRQAHALSDAGTAAVRRVTDSS